jgi:NAD+ kinase
MDSSERGVAVAGDGGAAALRDALASHPYRSVERADADAIVAVGDDALRDALCDAPDAPVIPVGTSRPGVDAGAADTASRVRPLLDAVFADDDDPTAGVRRATHPILTVDTGDGEPRCAAFDVALVTAEPARISEFALGFAGGSDGTVRADGVVVATPLGSAGYAAAAGGPVVDPGGGLSVAAIAPFSTRTDAWVAAGGLAISVARETESVSLVVDGRERGTVTPHRAVAIDVADSVTVVTRVDAHERADRKHSNNS